MGNKLLIILLMGCLLVACTIEINNSASPLPAGEVEKVPVSIRLVLNTGVDTKASDWEYDKYFPQLTPEEKDVFNILIIVFKSDLLEEYIYFGQGDENGKFTQGSNSTIQLEEKDGDVIELEPGPHHFYAILNLPAELLTSVMAILEHKEDILSKDAFEKQVIQTLSVDYMTGNGLQFIMTNTEPPALRGIYSPEQMTNSNGRLNNNVDISVGRAVGKISLAYVASEPGNLTGELHGSLSDIKYRVAYKPGSMFCMPVIENNILKTPHYQGNYSSGYFTPTIDRIMEEDDWLEATTPESNFSDRDLFHYEYCFENNNQSPRKTNSTMLLIKAVFTPPVWLDKAGNPLETPPAGKTFYRVGLYNSREVLTVYMPGYFSEEPDEYIDILTAALSNNDRPLYTYKAVKYENGICYYGCWPTNTAGKHVIKRNDFCRIAITHIHGAGEPEPGEIINPDVDPDEEPTYGSAWIYLVSWNDIDRTIVVGEEPGDNSATGNIDPTEWEEEEQEKELGGGSQWD